jgi:hypothetical protein
MLNLRGKSNWPLQLLVEAQLLQCNTMLMNKPMFWMPTFITSNWMPSKSVFKTHVSAWIQSRNMQSFSSNKAQLLQYFPSVKGWINWWSLPVHAVLMFPGVRQDMLGETDEMYGHLPSTNNTAEASNSMESRFCRHNVELVPSIHDSYRITLRQQKLHEGILSGATSHTHFNRNRKFFLLTLSQAK